MPEGLFISRYYWDVEFGGTDLDQRSQAGTWQQFADSGIPRDGGMAEGFQKGEQLAGWMVLVRLGRGRRGPGECFLFDGQVGV